MPERVCVECGRRKPHAARGLCNACYKRARRRDPLVAERSREVSRAWKARNRERTREYDAQYDRVHRGTCEVCGGPMGIGVPDGGVCRPCRMAGREQKRQLIVALWAQGQSLRQIAGQIGTSQNRIGVEVNTMRALGYDLPYRRTPEQRARIRAGSRAGLERIAA